MKTKLLACVMMFAVCWCLSTGLNAQDSGPFQTKAKPNGQLAGPPTPKLGVMVENHWECVQVNEVFRGSPADRLGLEPGDRILEINGRPCRNTDEMSFLLRAAVHQNKGQVRVLIDNVRARYNEPGAERYISRRTWLDGYEAFSHDNGGNVFKSGQGG